MREIIFGAIWSKAYLQSTSHCYFIHRIKFIFRFCIYNNDDLFDAWHSLDIHIDFYRSISFNVSHCSPTISAVSLYMYLSSRESITNNSASVVWTVKILWLEMNKMILCVRFELTTAIMNFVCCMLNCERLWDERCWLHQHWTESTYSTAHRSLFRCLKL